MINNYIITPLGNTINLLDGTKPVLSTHTIVWNNTATAASTPLVEDYTTNYNANYVFTILNKAILSPNVVNPDFTQITLPPLSPWASILPNTQALNTPIVVMTVSGTGFSTAITQLQFEDVSSDIVVVSSFNLNSPTSITIENTLTFFTVAGAYTLYWSPDYGTTWNSTGLIITAQ